MKVIKQRQISKDDWQYIDSEADVDALPAGKIVVSMPFWQTHRQHLSQHKGQLGIELAPEDNIADIAADLDHFILVALRFPAFRDGRAYSQARSLRNHFNYRGELRARGNVLRDQLMYMERVGFDSFEIDAKQQIEEALSAFDEIGVKYQSSSDEPLPLYKRRIA
jgi:uncharacterized protein (DUF934 family)